MVKATTQGSVSASWSFSSLPGCEEGEVKALPGRRGAQGLLHQLAVGRQLQVAEGTRRERR